MMFLGSELFEEAYLIAIAATHRESSHFGFGIVRGHCKLRLRLGQHVLSIDGSRERSSGRTLLQQSANQANGLTERSKTWWSAITPARYSPKNAKETKNIRTRAPRVPNAVAKYGTALTIRAVPTPAPTDAAKQESWALHPQRDQRQRHSH